MFHMRRFIPAFDAHLLMSFAYGFQQPMSSALCVFINASETGHAEGVPIAPSRERSVSFPILREPWLHV